LYLTAYPILEALGVTCAFGIVAFLAGSVSLSGLLGGIALGSLLYYLAGWGAFVVLGSFFVIGSGLTRLGYRRKAALGLAQERGGRRGARHALANCAVGLLSAALYRYSGGNPLLGAALVGSFATAAADTAGTEAGSLFGRTAVLPTTFRRVAPGTPGAVSLEGTLATVLAAAALALVGWLVGLLPSTGFVAAVTAGAFLGAWLESVLGALPRVEQFLGNEGMNLFNTATGAILCLLIAMLIG
jgi:uncharacterized protein (TIGR00297 family)